MTIHSHGGNTEVVWVTHNRRGGCYLSASTDRMHILERFFDDSRETASNQLHFTRGIDFLNHHTPLRSTMFALVEFIHACGDIRTTESPRIDSPSSAHKLLRLPPFLSTHSPRTKSISSCFLIVCKAKEREDMGLARIILSW